MQFYNFIIRYRFWLSILAFIIGIALQIANLSGFWPVFPLYFLGIIGIVSHFLIGPIRLIQTPMEKGDFDEVKKILDSIWFPNLLFKPVRSTYYTIKGNLAMMNQDFNTAEKFLKRSSAIGTGMAEADGANKLQLAMMAMQKGNIRQAEAGFKGALKIGIPDKESEAIAYLGLCQIYMTRREFRAAKDYFRKAKNCKPTQPQVVSQIKEIEKYIARIPG